LEPLTAEEIGNKIDMIIDTIRKSRADILMMQKMHMVDEKMISRVEKECEGSLFVNNGASNSRGVATYVRNKDSWQIRGEQNKDIDGRALGLSVGIDDEMWFFLNSYAPNDAKLRSDFFIQRANEIERSNARRIVSDQIRRVTGHIIDLDQGCGLPGRTIHDQLYYLNELTEYFTETGKTAMIVTIDQEKAFDKVEHDFLFRILKKI
jgi:hypothetical protein